MTPDDGKTNGAGEGSRDGAAHAAEAPEASAPESPEQSITRLEREKAEGHERLLRVAADFENYKRRAKRDMDDASIRAKEQILKEVLPVLDNLDRALQAAARGGAAGNVEALSQGVKLVEKQLLTGLEKFGVKSFESKGQPFDPARHEAIQQIESATLPAGTVAEEFARGYFIGDRLLRPAMVAVAKAAPGGASDGGDGAE